MRAGLALLCAAWMCACSPAGPQKNEAPAELAATEAAQPTDGTAAAPRAAPFTLDFDGYGPVRIGMSVAEAERAMGRTFKHGEYTDDPQACDLLWVEGDPAYADLSFMQQEGRITRIATGYVDGRAPGFRTAQGIGLGSDVAAVRAAFGNRLSQEVAPYVGPPSYELYVWRTPDRGMRFSINGDTGRVTTIYVGARSIEYWEDCL